MTKRSKILNHLTSGKSLTKIQCIKLFRYLNLGGYVNELRNRGYHIITTMIKNSDKSRYAKYSLKEQL